MKIENMERASDIVQQIKNAQASINNFENETVLNLKIELQFAGGSISDRIVKKTTPAYKRIVEILTEPLYRDIERLQKEFDELNKS